jgi:hypothetical protein
MRSKSVTRCRQTLIIRRGAYRVIIVIWRTVTALEIIST